MLTFTALFPFCGLGGGARGFLDAQVRHEGVLEMFAEAGQGIYLHEWLVAEGTLSRRLAADASRFRERYHSDPVFREKVKARTKAWARANSERVAAYQKAYKEANREHLLEYWRERDARLRAEQPEVVREKARERQQRYRERLRAEGKEEEYLARGRERARASYLRRRQAGDERGAA